MHSVIADGSSSALGKRRFSSCFVQHQTLRLHSSRPFIWWQFQDFAPLCEPGWTLSSLDYAAAPTGRREKLPGVESNYRPAELLQEERWAQKCPESEQNLKPFSPPSPRESVWESDDFSSSFCMSLTSLHLKHVFSTHPLVYFETFKCNSAFQQSLLNEITPVWRYSVIFIENSRSNPNILISFHLFLFI